MKDQIPRESYLARYPQISIAVSSTGGLGFVFTGLQSAITLEWYFTLFNLLPMNSLLCRLLCLESAWLSSKTFMLLVL